MPFRFAGTLLLLLFVSLIAPATANAQDPILPGAHQTSEYIPLLKGKRVAIVANHTSRIYNVHLLDTLLSLKVNVKKIFCPEHGFRGTEDAGAKIKSGKDKKTGLPIISLYGASQKPKAADLSNIDIVIFDMQDVGVRFYTYVSTMRLVMEACAENKKQLLILDRPNPNGFYVDGPVLEKSRKSFVGLDPVPVVYGLTIAEYANMANKEGWLSSGTVCDLKFILCKNYTHSSRYELPVKPSPNLPGMTAIYLYPSLCFFEGTIVSVGRGTDIPFTVIGYPGHPAGDITFSPRSIPGAAKNPMYEGKECRGYDLKPIAEKVFETKELDLSWLIRMYSESAGKDTFFNNYFDNLAGTPLLRKQIKEQTPLSEIRKSWEPALSEFKEKRKKYLLYTE